MVGWLRVQALEYEGVKLAYRCEGEVVAKSKRKRTPEEGDKVDSQTREEGKMGQTMGRSEVLELEKGVLHLEVE